MSVDIAVEADEMIIYSPQFMNSFDLPGMLPHVLHFEIGITIIMLRNINQPKLSNSTRLALRQTIEQRCRSNNLDRTLQR